MIMSKSKKVIEIFKIDSPVGTERVIIDYRETGEGVSSTLRIQRTAPAGILHGHGGHADRVFKTCDDHAG